MEGRDVLICRAQREALSAALQVLPGDVVAAVGCGGKTALLRQLGREWSACRALFSPTTKISVQQGMACDFFYRTPQEWGAPSPLPGLHGAGVLVPERGKVQAIPERDLESLCTKFDLMLLEADGSRGQPLKGWRENEPVLPTFVTKTVGVMPVAAIGVMFCEGIVFQPELFQELCDLKMGEKIGAVHIASAIAHPRGLFQHARGRRILFFNQVETNQGQYWAEKIISLLPRLFRSSLDGIVIGSVHSNSYRKIGERL